MGRPTLPGEKGDTSAEVFVLEKWGSLNTKASRPAIADNDFSYIMNLFPIGDGNLRTLYGEGSTIYTASGLTIIYIYPFNLSNTKYIAVFLSDGSAKQVRVSDGATTTIGAASTFGSTSILPACAQHGASEIVIVSQIATDAYWIWNGTSLFKPGSLSSEVDITSGGSGYSSAPTVTAYGGSGSGATFSATVANGEVVDVTVTSPGTGYTIGQQVVLAFSGGGGQNGAAGTATVTTSSGGVSAVIVTNPGTGATAACTLSFSGGGGSGAQAVIGSAINGQITSVVVLNPGTGYTSAPALAASDGTGFTAAVIVTQGQVTAITVAAGGASYVTPPLVTIDGDGVGGEARAVLTAGAVSSFVIINAGYGYSYAKIILDSGNNAAQALIDLMPFGVSGDTVEIYQQRVWVGDADKALFTAPESLTDFSASSGGGAYPVSDSFTRYRITKFIQNNFLYQLMDSSVNVISNVQTSGLPAITSFNNENVDPQVGTSWPGTVVAFGRATMFANPTGVYALFGGAAQKVSDQLDGLFANASFNTGASGITPTATVFDLFSIKVYGFLFTTVDPYSGSTVNLLAIWDGKKWFLGNQIKTLLQVSTQELDSTITAWGHDGTHLFPLFQTANASLSKIAQTKLAQLNTYLWIKQVNRFYVMAMSNDANVAEIDIGIDTESGLGTLTNPDNPIGSITFIGAGQQAITFLGAGSVPIVWTVSNLLLYGYRVANYGKLIGVTVSIDATDATLMSMTGEYNPNYGPYA